jgi:16S rRNA (uracil1498-N3)-methyltransferase
MSQRFFVERPIGDAATAQLLDAEARHLVKVMRANVGDKIIVFDGSGWEFIAGIATIRRSAVELEIIDRLQVDRELSHSLTLAVSLPKGDRQRVLVEKLVELGATALIPLETRWSVAEATPAALARLRRQVIEASKQCGRNRLMEIGEPRSLEQFLAQSASLQRRLLAHPSGEELKQAERGPTLAAVGPEGGFKDEEIAAARTAGWEIVSLGRRILRIETASIALAALLAKQSQ